MIRERQREVVIRSVRLHHTLVIRHMNKSHELVMFVIYLKRLLGNY
jgi:hypothetical protein